jgi:putative CocE/NonD family hydrolase
MSDGVELKIDHYWPKAGGTFPTILVRTPYGRGMDAPFPIGLLFVFAQWRLAAHGYHVVAQTVRGRFDSGGSFNPLFHEAMDGRDTVQWLTRQPWFNGKLGMTGPSYLGYVQWAVAATSPGALAAMVPQLTGSHMDTLIYPDGAFALDLALRWCLFLDTLDSEGRRSTMAMLRRMSTAVVDRLLIPAFAHLPLQEADSVALGQPVPYYREWLAHPDLSDRYWEATNLKGAVPWVSAPVHLMGGWYDILLRELLRDYTALQAAGRAPYLTIGPWWHSDVRAARAAQRESLMWCAAYLKGNRAVLRERPVRVYVMGANAWRDLPGWPPPARETRYFLQPGASLSLDAPPVDAIPDHYRYDPADPTPSVGGTLLLTGGPRDNGRLEARADVLCFTTAPLDADLEIIGPISLDLYVRSSLGHTDFAGRLCDVHPDGRSINICDGLLRLNPGTDGVQPDGSRRIQIDLWATAHRFRRGHRLRLQVSSGAHPRWSRNLGTGEPIGAATSMIAADQTIYHDWAHPSALVLPVV